MRFGSSAFDFPALVELGECVPSWEVSRWGGSAALRFIPLDDEGFAVRSGSRRLLYKGRRRSHRFTILGGDEFEYDCILLCEPSSNVISVMMEGWEDFDFFRQPDFVPDPVLRGSYAVYKKETLIGEGTGKLLHIHRPEIIDSRGHRCWGELSVDGNLLNITIPEQFLSGASYPVIVDPVVGTQTIGRQTHWYNADNDSNDRLYVEASVAVNRFRIAQDFNGIATAYVYAYHNDYEGRCMPVLYSDSGTSNAALRNVPQIRRSAGETSFDTEVRAGKAAGWRTARFNSNIRIAAGTDVWFGLFADWFAPRFDFGTRCYMDYWDHLGNGIPNRYPLWSANWFFDFRLSAYFTYSTSQNYVRTLTQGVSLTDSRKHSGAYCRSIKEIASNSGRVNRAADYVRKCLTLARALAVSSRLALMVRDCVMSVQAAVQVSRWRNILRTVTANVRAAALTGRGLLLTVRIVSEALIMEKMLGRKPRVRDEMVLKSKICREIMLDSSIK